MNGMKTAKRRPPPVGGKAVLFHKCPGCDWYRMIPFDEKDRHLIYVHKVYGPISVINAARLEVKNHVCTYGGMMTPKESI